MNPEHHHPPADASNALHQFHGVDPVVEPEDDREQEHHEPGTTSENIGFGELAGDPTDEILGSPPIVSEKGELADPRLPDNEDWASRPYSSSEFFVEPAVETGLAATLLRSPRNFPAVLGVWMALLGFLGGLWGVVLALLGLGFSSAGVYTARHGGRRMAVAVAGVLIASTYLIAHAVMRI